MDKQRIISALTILIPVFLLAFALPFAVKRVSNLQEKQTTESEASVGGGSVSMSLNPASGSVLANGTQPVSIVVNAATTPGNLGITGIKAVIAIADPSIFSIIDPLADISVPLPSPWTYVRRETTISGGSQIITIEAVYLSSGTTGYISSTPFTFTTLNLKAGTSIASTAFIVQSPSEVRAKQDNSDILNSVSLPNGSFAVVAPSPTPTNTPIPTATPTPTLVPTATPVPTVLINSYTATPSSGSAPLGTVRFTAAVGGTATGSITYEFDCNNSGSFDFTTTTTVNPFTTGQLCSGIFNSAGTYTTRVRVTRQGVVATANSTIVVTAPPTPTPTLTPTPTPTPLPTATPTPTPLPTATPTPVPASINFQVAYQHINSPASGRTKPVTVTLQQGGTVAYTFSDVATTSSGTNSFAGSVNNIVPGTYDVYIKGPVHLRRKMTASPVVLVSGTQAFNWITTPLLAGDTVGDNTIQLNDITPVIAAWTQVNTPVSDSDPDKKYDIDDNGFIALADVTAIIANWLTSIVTGD